MSEARASFIGAPSRRSVTSNQAGVAAERRARLHYRLRGYRVLGANVWAGGYELDIILRRGRKLVFCEVKAKGGSGYGDPLEMITAEKLRRLIRAGEAWLASHPECAGLDSRFEAIGVSPRGVRRVIVLA